MTNFRLNLRKVTTIIACLAVIMFSGCKKDADPPSVDEEGLTENIHNIIPDEYIETLIELGFEINGGNMPPNIDGKYLAETLELVATNTFGGIAKQWDMYVTFSGQNNNTLTVNADYTMQSEQGPLSANGSGSYIVGKGNKFTVFVDAERKQDGYTAKTVEFFSGEIITNGIKNYQWGVIMVDNAGDPLNVWIGNGIGYVKKAGNGLATKVD